MIDSPGLIEANHQLVLSLVSGQTRTPAEIANIVVKTTPAGTPVRIGDIATVAALRDAGLHRRHRQRQARRAAEHQSASPTATPCWWPTPCTRKSNSIRKTLPRGVELRPFYDQSESVTDSISSVRDAILIGLILASIIMVLFLRDWGTSLVAGLVIPATIAVTFIALRVLGESFNLMTLGGLAAAVGLVIDDAIVVVENIVMHRDAGQSRAEAIRSAIREIRVPLVGSTITPIVVFLPLIAITGVTGVFFRALAVTVGMALLTSLALALTWTPTLSHYFIRQRAGAAHRGGARMPCRRWLMSAYERVLRAHARASAGAGGFSASLLIAGSYFCYKQRRVRPAARHGRRRLHRRLHHARRLVAGGNQPRDHAMWRRFCAPLPEVENTSRRTGLQLGLAQVTEANTGDISVKLKARPQAQRRRSDRRRARQGHGSRAGARRRIPAAACRT